MGRPHLNQVLLFPSILLGPVSWRAAAAELRSRGRSVAIADAGDAATPAAALARYLAATPHGPVTIAGHSNAGYYLPGVLAERPQATAIYVDASLPRLDGPTVMAEGPRLEALARLAGADVRLPPWPAWWGADLADLLPDEHARRELTGVDVRLPLAYFTTAFTTPPGWAERRSGYLSFDGAFEPARRQAEGFGWPTAHLPGNHLHLMNDPAAVVEALLALERRLLSGEG